MEQPSNKPPGTKIGDSSAGMAQAAMTNSSMMMTSKTTAGAKRILDTLLANMAMLAKLTK